MTRTFIKLLPVMLLFLLSCRQNDAQKHPHFNTYEGNPILVSGDSGSWDDYYVVLPNVIYDHGIFYMFYMGSNNSGVVCVGLATSTDGYTFSKFPGNPVLRPDGDGFDAFGVGAPVVIKEDSVWFMYFNSLERADWGPGQYIGLAHAAKLEGPWIKEAKPILTVGKRGTWDSGFVFPSSVIRGDDGTWMMYYTGGSDFVNSENQFLGLAFSSDGRKWKKYNDPVTAETLFAESDPVLITGEKDKWDGMTIWTASVLRVSAGYRMIFGGSTTERQIRFLSAGYATSSDGIRWEKFQGNPVFSISPDFTAADHVAEVTFEGPSLLFPDTECLMYYDYALVGKFEGQIGVATAKMK